MRAGFLKRRMAELLLVDRVRSLRRPFLRDPDGSGVRTAAAHLARCIFLLDFTRDDDGGEEDRNDDQSRQIEYQVDECDAGTDPDRHQGQAEGEARHDTPQHGQLTNVLAAFLAEDSLRESDQRPRVAHDVERVSNDDQHHRSDSHDHRDRNFVRKCVHETPKK